MEWEKDFVIARIPI